MKSKTIQKNKGLARPQAGMSYVELIVVLSIFAVLSTVIIYNYGQFQSKVDIKGLASDIGLKIVEAQKSSLSGVMPQASVSSTWKPSYGVYFAMTASGGSGGTDNGGGNVDGGDIIIIGGGRFGGGGIMTPPTTYSPSKNFIYFVDLDQDGLLYNPSCNPGSECIENIAITKGNVISSLDVFYQGDTTAHNLNDLTITFSRPNSGANIKSSSSFTNTVSYAQITILTPKGSTSTIKVYPSGRIQVN